MTTRTRFLAHVRRTRLLGGRWVALLVVALTLGVLPALAQSPAGAANAPVCFLDANGTLTCPSDGADQPAARYDPPPLLNPRLVAAAPATQATALEHFQTRAADLVLAGHHLPDSDRDAVLTWARPETEAVLWGLVVDAVHTGKAARTGDQQAVVDWMAARAAAQEASAAQQAGAEYATWAGLDLSDYRALARTGTEDQLRSFLSQDPVNYGRTGSAECTKLVCTIADEQGGYCNYRSPDPYGSEYTGYTNQTCYVPCTGMICLPPAPSFDQLVTWGTAVATQETRSKGYQVAYGSIATGAVAASSTLVSTTAALAVTVLTDIYAQVAVESFLADTALALWGVEVGTYASAYIAAASGAAVAVAALLAGVLVTMDFVNQKALPGKLASLVVGARTTGLDPATMLDSDAGRQSLFSQFVSATLPSPRADASCDNSLIPLELWGGQQDQVVVQDPATGGRRTVSTRPCLNRPPVAAFTDQGPRFHVYADGSPAVDQRSLALPVPGQEGYTTKVSVTGNWFVQEVSDGRSTFRAQSLGLTYRDWDGQARYVTTYRQADGRYLFRGLTQKSMAQNSMAQNAMAEGADPTTCGSEDRCFASAQIHVVGADGRKYVVSLRE